MKIARIVIAVVICMALSLSFSAHTVIDSVHYQNEDITVVFDTNSVFSSEQKQFIADILVSGEFVVDDGISPYSLCWLTGHDIVNESVTVFEHKISPDNPRCRENVYTVESCTKCDHLEYTLIYSEMTLCCPEE